MGCMVNWYGKFSLKTLCRLKCCYRNMVHIVYMRVHRLEVSRQNFGVF